MSRWNILFLFPAVKWGETECGHCHFHNKMTVNHQYQSSWNRRNLQNINVFLPRVFYWSIDKNVTTVLNSAKHIANVTRQTKAYFVVWPSTSNKLWVVSVPRRSKMGPFTEEEIPAHVLTHVGKEKRKQGSASADSYSLTLDWVNRASRTGWARLPMLKQRSWQSKGE